MVQDLELDEHANDTGRAGTFGEANGVDHFGWQQLLVRGHKFLDELQ